MYDKHTAFHHSIVSMGRIPPVELSCMTSKSLPTTLIHEDGTLSTFKSETGTPSSFSSDADLGGLAVCTADRHC